MCNDDGDRRVSTMNEGYDGRKKKKYGNEDVVRRYTKIIKIFI